MISWERVIIRYRHLNGLTQAAFGEMVGVEQATVSRWERGNQRPDLRLSHRSQDKEPKAGAPLALRRLPSHLSVIR